MELNFHISVVGAMQPGILQPNCKEKRAKGEACRLGDFKDIPTANENEHSFWG